MAEASSSSSSQTGAEPVARRVMAALADTLVRLRHHRLAKTVVGGLWCALAVSVVGWAVMSDGSGLHDSAPATAPPVSSTAGTLNATPSAHHGDRVRPRARATSSDWPPATQLADATTAVAGHRAATTTTPTRAKPVSTTPAATPASEGDSGPAAPSPPASTGSDPSAPPTGTGTGTGTAPAGGTGTAPAGGTGSTTVSVPPLASVTVGDPTSVTVGSVASVTLGRAPQPSSSQPQLVQAGVSPQHAAVTVGAAGTPVASVQTCSSGLDATLLGLPVDLGACPTS